MRKALFTLVIVLIGVVLATAASSALAQDSGTDQYLENPGAVPNGGGDGGGGSGGGSQQAPSSEPPVGSAPSGGGSVDPGTAAGAAGTATESTTTADPSEAEGSADDAGSRKRKRDDKNKAAKGKREENGNPDLAQSAVGDSGSSGLGIILPIVLGASLLLAGVVAIVRSRRHAKTGHG